MYTLEKPAPDQITLKLTNGLDADEMNALLDEFLAHAEGLTNGKMLYIIEDFEMPSLGAIGVEMKRLPKLYSLIGKFSRCAVVSDQGWIDTVAKAQGAVFRNLDIETFKSHETSVAQTWLDTPRNV